MREWITALIHEEIDLHVIPAVAKELADHDRQLRAELPALVEHYVRHDLVASRENLARQKAGIAQSHALLDFMAHKQHRV